MEHPIVPKSSLAMWDITIPVNHIDKKTDKPITYTHEQIINVFDEHCTRWTFQLEKGEETGYLHFQCRVSLKVKRRVGGMEKWLLDHLPGSHCSPTNTKVFREDNFFYVMKEDSRVEGPWDSRKVVATNQLPYHLRATPNWYPWQQKVLSMISDTPCTRTINLIIDAIGNQGKSTLTCWLGARKLAQRIPQQRESRDIMRMVMDAPKRACYFIDLPRATCKNDQRSIYAALEEIKNGYAYDERYHWREEYFNPPHVWVFTNVTPDISLVTSDRWRFWTINPLTRDLIQTNSQGVGIPTLIRVPAPTLAGDIPKGALDLVSRISGNTTVPEIPTPPLSPLKILPRMMESSEDSSSPIIG